MSSFASHIKDIAQNMEFLKLGLDETNGCQHKKLPEVPKNRKLLIETGDSECCVCMENIHNDKKVAKFSACSHWVCSVRCSGAYGPNKRFEKCPLCRTRINDDPKHIEFTSYKNLPKVPIVVVKNLPEVPLLSAGRGPIPDASPENIQVGIIYR